MMAKMFYTLDEAKATLGKSEEEIKQMAREGRLREFRDGSRLMFKADQVDALRAEMGGGRRSDTGGSDSGTPIGGVAGSGMTGITLEGGSGIHDLKKGDTALTGEPGLSGTHARPAGGSGLTGSRAGVDVFQPGEVESIDPSAQTALTPSGEQISLEGVGSGSGLLDLTRESDDTSLGAALLDEITPGGSASGAGGAPADTSAGSMAGIVASEGGGGRSTISRGAIPITYVEARDPWGVAFGITALGAFFVVLFGTFALITGIYETRPEILTNFGKYENQFLTLSGMALGIVLVFFIIGLIIGFMTQKK